MKILKKIILMGVAIVFMVSNTTAQDKNEIKEILIDFSDKSIYTGEVDIITVGEYYRLVIDNINLNLYSVAVNFSDTSYSKPLETPTFTNLGIETVSQVVSELSGLNVSVTKSDHMFTRISKIISSLSSNLSFIRKESKKDIQQIIIREQEKIFSFSKKYEKISEKIEKLKLKIYKSYFDALKSSSVKDNFDFEDMLQMSYEIISELEALKNQVDTNFSDFQEKISPLQNEKKDKEVKQKLSMFVEKYKELNGTLTEAITAYNVDIIKGLLPQVMFMINGTKNKYTSVPFQFNGEQAIVKYTITPRDPKYLLQTYSSSITFPSKKPIYFSVGLSFFGSTLYNEAYSIVGTAINDSTSIYNIVKENNNKLELGIASLFRIGYKVDKKRYMGLHFNFGPGITISNKIQPRILLGGGLSYGKKHNVSLDFGLITGYVDVLSNAVSEDETYSTKPDAVTVTGLKAGGYLSLGYFFNF